MPMFIIYEQLDWTQCNYQNSNGEYDGVSDWMCHLKVFLISEILQY